MRHAVAVGVGVAEGAADGFGVGTAACEGLAAGATTCAAAGDAVACDEHAAAARMAAAETATGMYLTLL